MGLLTLYCNKMITSFRITRGLIPWLLSSLMFTLSCSEEVADPWAESFESLNVINGLAKAGETLVVFFGSSNDILANSGSNPLSLDYSILTINETLSDTLYSLDESHYCSSHYLYSSDRITLKAVTINGDTLTACDTIPEPVKIESANFISHAYTSVYGTDYGMAVVEFQDPPEQNNYYELLFLRGSNYIQGFKIQNEFINIDFENDPNPPNTILFSDAHINGSAAHLEVFLNTANSPKVILRSCSRAYYQYKKSLHLHLSTQNNSRDDIYDMFSGDPVELYTNVEGGLGIVASYAEYVYNL